MNHQSTLPFPARYNSGQSLRDLLTDLHCVYSIMILTPDVACQVYSYLI